MYVGFWILGYWRGGFFLVRRGVVGNGEGEGFS